MSTEDVFVVEGSLCTLLDLCQKVEKTVAQLVEAGYVDKLQIPIADNDFNSKDTLTASMTIFDRIIEEHGDAGLLALVKSMRANGLHFTASQIEKAHPGLGVQVRVQILSGVTYDINAAWDWNIEKVCTEFQKLYKKAVINPKFYLKCSRVSNSATLRNLNFCPGDILMVCFQTHRRSDEAEYAKIKITSMPWCENHSTQSKASILSPISKPKMESNYRFSLFHKGVELHVDKRLSDYKINPGDCLKLLVKHRSLNLPERSEERHNQILPSRANQNQGLEEAYNEGLLILLKIQLKHPDSEAEIPVGTGWSMKKVYDTVNNQVLNQ